MAIRPNRYVCPRCKRTKLTARPHAECEYCGEPMIDMVIWVRRQCRKNKPPKKEKDE